MGLPLDVFFLCLRRHARFGIIYAVRFRLAVIEKNLVERIGEARERGLPSLGLQLAFPNCDAMPAHLRQLLLHGFVALLVAAYFRNPIVLVRLRRLIILAVDVSVPKAAVHENADAVSAQHDVGLAGQPLVVEPIAVAETPKEFAHNQLGLRVFAAIGRH